MDFSSGTAERTGSQLAYGNLKRSEFMKRNIEALSGSRFDVAVIGGGINGAAIAREAALRGWKVALVEARDFASGTSSRSSKLIHGGLRYLEQGEFRLVREARKERRLLMRLAPHLVRPLPFLLPIYRGDPYYPLKIRLGLSIYDWMGNAGPQDRHHFYSPAETLQRVPALRPDDLRAGAVYYDSETDDARLSLENVLDAAELGAVVVNHAQARAFSRAATGGVRIGAAEVEDRLTGRKYELAAHFWVNAAGPWVDGVRSLVPGYDGSKTIRMTKGTHVILPSISERDAIFAAVEPGDRIFLAMPWHGCMLLGTTDTDYQGDPGLVEPHRADVEYLLKALNRVLRKPMKLEDALGSFAGIRALVIQQGRSPSANTREHRLHRDPWAKNLVTVCGGKLTTARALGEALMQLIAPELPFRAAFERRSHSSRFRPLPGGSIEHFDSFMNSAVAEAAGQFGISPPTARRIAETYGSRWRKVLEPIRSEKSLGYPLPENGDILAAEVRFAAREEMAATVEDFLLRRSGLSWTAPSNPGLADAVSKILEAELSWSDVQGEGAG
jgi:glycerol-3-phosphate dehydrogenase